MSVLTHLARIANDLLKPIGIELRRPHDIATADALAYDFNDQTRDIIQHVKPFTMTSAARIAALVDATLHVVRNHIPGDMVECGVWKGGSSMAMALALQKSGITDRTLWLYDTFDGMSEPTEADKSYDGADAAGQLASQRKDVADSVWCCSPIDEVKHHVTSTGYPESRLRFVQGRVEDTVPEHVADRIALLRLDTDWYESTRHELEHLYPRLMPGGVLIIDDYGYWQGARKAVDEYFAAHDTNIFLARIDSTARIAIKPW